jgi:hypothetical protein
MELDMNPPMVDGNVIWGWCGRQGKLKKKRRLQLHTDTFYPYSKLSKTYRAKLKAPIHRWNRAAYFVNRFVEAFTAQLPLRQMPLASTDHGHRHVCSFVSIHFDRCKPSKVATSVKSAAHHQLPSAGWRVALFAHDRYVIDADMARLNFDSPKK